MTLFLRDGDVCYLVSLLSDSSMCDVCTKDYTLEANVPVWKIANHENAICGASPRCEVNFIRYDKDIFDCGINIKDLTVVSYPRIKEKVEKFDLLEDGRPGTSYIVAEKDKAYRINCEGGVLELDDFFAIGYYACNAMYAAEVTRGMPIDKRIRRIVEIVSASGSMKAYPIAVMNTRDTKLEIWEK